MDDLISRAALLAAYDKAHKGPPGGARKLIQEAPAMSTERYNDLREAFVDYVCTGVPNPAPYCTNRRPECIDGHGWCRTENCRGFNPDGETEANHAEQE